jgi:hypothetical protein
MRYRCIFGLSALEVIFLGSFAVPLSSPWDNMYTKHSWDTVPKNWESLGSPPSGTTIDHYIELKPHHENALIDVLYEVSNPRHPKHVLHHYFDHACAYMATGLVQISYASFQGACL